MLITIPLIAHTVDVLRIEFETKEIESQAKADLKNMNLFDWLNKYCPDYVDEVDTCKCEYFEIDDEALNIELAEDNRIED